jgi:hypothetical protein
MGCLSPRVVDALGRVRYRNRYIHFLAEEGMLYLDRVPVAGRSRDLGTVRKKDRGRRELVTALEGWHLRRTVNGSKAGMN